MTMPPLFRALARFVLSCDASAGAAMFFCCRCVELEDVHNEKLDRYIALVEQQSRLFRDGKREDGRLLDTAIAAARSARDDAMHQLMAHHAAHA